MEALKHCIVTNKLPDDAGNREPSGFYQWKNVFKSRIIQARRFPAELEESRRKAVIMHIRLTKEDCSLPSLIRKRIGNDDGIKIVLTVDTGEKYRERHGLTKEETTSAIKNADFVFATMHPIARNLESIAGKPIYEIADPVDIQKFYGIREGQKEAKVLLAGNGLNSVEVHLIKILCGIYKFRLEILSQCRGRYVIVDRENKREYSYSNDYEFSRKIAGYHFVIVPRYCEGFEKLIVYAAASGCLVIAHSSFEAVRRCYPFTTVDAMDILKIKNIIAWMVYNKTACDFIQCTAVHKVECYNWGNSGKKFLDCLYTLSGDCRFQYHNLPKELPDDTAAGLTVFTDEIRYVCGKRTIKYNRDELAVVCLVRNGSEYLNAFFSHYRLMGIRHFIFVDNGSADSTVPFLKQQPDVTLYTTDLLHKNYESEIRRSVIEEHCRNCWCLCVDIDELFDYPCSDKLSLSGFLAYLNKRQFTAVVAYMVDMFAKQLKFGDKFNDWNLKEKYCYYDLSGIRKTGYFAYNKNYNNYNLLSDRKMRIYYGGIRQKKFKTPGSRYLLTKHPLMFIDHRLEPVTDAHYCNKAYIADVNAVLTHFKFIESFNEKVKESVEKQRYSYFTHCEYAAYHNALKDTDEITFYSSKAKKYNMNDLINSGFLRISENYREFVDSEPNRQPPSQAKAFTLKKE